MNIEKEMTNLDWLLKITRLANKNSDKHYSIHFINRIIRNVNHYGNYLFVAIASQDCNLNNVPTEVLLSPLKHIEYFQTGNFILYDTLIVGDEASLNYDQRVRQIDFTSLFGMPSYLKEQLIESMNSKVRSFTRQP